MSTGHGGPVLLVDDHPLISTALAVALRAEGVEAWRVPVTTAEAVLATVEQHPPGLLLLDLDLGDQFGGPRPNGLQLLGPLRTRGWSVLLVTASQDRHALAAAITGGALGWVSKGESFERLLATVLDAVSGREVLAEYERSRLLALYREDRNRTDTLTGKLGRLTLRERQVLDLLGSGHSPRSIAQEFTVSLATVRAQIRAILAKLEVQSQLAAVAILNEATRTGSG
jgi:DNA-binding NarL/FixJ family response regulator